ncbi:unnamed protein product [Arctia plantaginis]|uniref:Uncharacterized protein n=1 Tax=Arctia plantaginis TaxID=874455 RepID=A0A8S1A5S6_ARCPL|nr:unnamed protein product [Arctia plantaginis]
MPTIEVEIDSDIIQSSTSQFSETNDDDGVYWQNKKNRMMDMEVHVLGEEISGNWQQLQYPLIYISNRSNNCKRHRKRYV